MVEWGFSVFGRTGLIAERQPVALTIGNFDGVHLGHLHVLKMLRDFKKDLPIVALTFDPHPTVVLSPQVAKPSLVPLSKRVDLLLAAGVDAVVVQKFSFSFAQLSADEFVDEYLLKSFNVQAAMIGFDFCYGANRSGNWEHFEAFSRRRGFAARQADPLVIDGAPVSSSRIRAAILSKEFDSARRMLGRDFCLNGVVVKGDQRGRQIGFPTANLGLFDENCLIPPFGVYAVEVLLPRENTSKPGVMNCGVRPTIADGLKLQIEAHILDYSGDLYGSEIAFGLRKFIRTEMKFSGLDNLKAQIQSDVNQARQYFGV
ncbi:MAG: riboflavin biosynthesis protein RibF [Betaproteobacteria bacterium]|nr:riboflavin biosynthesis protein RibF [Betaproteobacteria bacterium]